MINKTELLALEWLKKLGYKEKNIIFRSNKTPDFICSDGKRYEVKFLYGDKVIFYSTQIKNLKNDDIILVFDKTKFITKFKWENKDQIPFSVKVMQIEEGFTTLRLKEETRKRLSEHGKHSQNFDDIVNELMDKVNGVK